MTLKILKGFNLFIDGTGYAGRVQEVTLPKITHSTEDFKLGGLDTPVQMDMGLEKLQCDFTLSEYNTEVIKQFGLKHSNRLDQALGFVFGFDTDYLPVTLRGALCDEQGAVIPVVVNLRGSIVELDFGSWKAGENAPLKVQMVVSYYRLSVGGEQLLEIDINNMVRKVGDDNQISIVRRYRKTYRSL